MSNASASYDVAVVGAGPGGYVAAIRAAQLGARVCIIERDSLGGTCLNRGCIPTKALAASVEAYEQALRGTEFGFVATDVLPDFPAMQERSAATVDRLVKGVQFLLRKNKVTHIQGHATLSGARSFRVETAEGILTVNAPKIIIATGSKPIVFPAFNYDGKQVVTSDELLRLSALPRRLVIIGGGVIGCEFASIFGALGSEVTVIEALPSLLPLFEKDVVRQLASYFRRRRIAVLTGTKVAAVDRGEMVTVRLADAEPITCDMVLVAIGRRANTNGLRLEQAGVEVNGRGEIMVDTKMATSIPGIYAVGDVTDVPWKLAHVASRQGVVAAHNAMEDELHMDYQAVPSAVFTSPEVASVGFTSERATEAGIDYVLAKFSFMGNGKAVAEGNTAGFAKVLAEKRSGRVIGAHIIGPQAATLVAEAALAIQHGLRADQLASTIHAHPTLSEVLMEAAGGIDGFIIHA